MDSKWTKGLVMSVGALIVLLGMTILVIQQNDTPHLPEISPRDQLSAQGVTYSLGDLTESERDALDFLMHYIRSGVVIDQVVVRKTTTTFFNNMRSFGSGDPEEPIWVVAFTTYSDFGADDIRPVEGDPIQDLNASLEQAGLPTQINPQAGTPGGPTPSPNWMAASGETTAYFVFRASTGDMVERGILSPTYPFFTLDDLAALPRE